MYKYELQHPLALFSYLDDNKSPTSTVVLPHVVFVGKPYDYEGKAAYDIYLTHSTIQRMVFSSQDAAERQHAALIGALEKYWASQR